MIFLIIIIWLCCSVLAYGMLFADLQVRYLCVAEEQYRENMSMSVLLSFFGPLSLFVIFFITGFAEHGLKFK